MIFCSKDFARWFWTGVYILSLNFIIAPKCMVEICTYSTLWWINLKKKWGKFWLSNFLKCQKIAKSGEFWQNFSKNLWFLFIFSYYCPFITEFFFTDLEWVEIFNHYERKFSNVSNRKTHFVKWKDFLHFPNFNPNTSEKFPIFQRGSLVIKVYYRIFIPGFWLQLTNFIAEWIVKEATQCWIA